MSPDEALVLVASLIVLLAAWTGWYWQAATIAVRLSPREGRPLLYVIPLVCVLVLWMVLRELASFDVREAPQYLFLYMALGLAWVGALIRGTAFAGISMRDDVLERRNGAAAIAIGGAMLGLTFAFAGGNIGDGPGWWVVVFAAGLATLALFLSWLALDALTGVSDAITIDRDRASGLRLAGFLVAAGLIVGRASAGDWVSAGATLVDFALVGWPVLPLLALATVAERSMRPTPERPAGSAVGSGVIPALLYILIAVGYVGVVGFGQ